LRLRARRALQDRRPDRAKRAQSQLRLTRMDFFAAQDLARARTRRLVVLFVLAVVAIVVSTSGLAFIALEHERFFPMEGEAPASSEAIGRVFLEHLDVFALVAAVT